MTDRDHGRRNDGPEILTIDPKRLGLPAGPQADATLITDCLLRARQHANVLAPAMQITDLPVDHVITFMVVLFPVDDLEIYRNRDGVPTAGKNQSNGIWYATDGGQLAHHRAALDMLAQAAGITWVHAKCGRTDDRSRVGLWSYRMTLQIKGLDGRTREVTREHELDLRSGDGSMSPAAAKAGKGLRNALIHGAQLCESKASNRCIRAALGLRAYDVDEARRPFVVPVLRWVPDASDPMVRRMIAAKELGLTRELFGAEAEASAQVHLVDGARVIDHDPRPARAARQLPDNSSEVDPWSGAEEQEQRNNDRQPVERAPWDEPKREAARPATDHPLDRYCDAKGWDRPDNDRDRDQLRRHVEGKGREDYDRTMRKLQAAP